MQSSEIFFELRRAVLTGEEDETLFQVIAAVTIQILKPSFVMDTVRSDADTLESSRSVLLKIWAETVGDNAEEACPLPTPAFSYAFTLLQHAVRKSLGDEDLVQKGCGVVSEHAQLREAIQLVILMNKVEFQLMPLYANRCTNLRPIQVRLDNFCYFHVFASLNNHS